MNLIINVFNELIQTMQAALKYFSLKKNKTEETSTIKLKVEIFFKISYSICIKFILIV